VPGHRESLRALQAPDVVYDFPEGMPIGCGHFEGLQDVLDRFLPSFYKALDVRFAAEEFIAAGEEVVALGRIVGKTRKTTAPIDVPFARSGRSARGISNDCVPLPTRQCWPMRWQSGEPFQLSFNGRFRAAGTM
jgi:hypothetical protein